MQGRLLKELTARHYLQPLIRVSRDFSLLRAAGAGVR